MIKFTQYNLAQFTNWKDNQVRGFFRVVNKKHSVLTFDYLLLGIMISPSYPMGTLDLQRGFSLLESQFMFSSKAYVYNKRVLWIVIVSRAGRVRKE